MAILEMNLLPIALHASTQAHNKSIEKIKFLELVGLSRAVLARKLSVNDIAHYQKIIGSAIASDKSCKRAASGTVTLSFLPNPERSFNRGYSTCFSNGRVKNLASLNTPKSFGKRLGKAILSAEGWFEIKSNETISNNDGLCYFSKNGRLINGVKVNNVHCKRIEINSKVNISPGTTIFRNYDHRFRQIIKNTNTAQRTIEGKIKITINQ